MINRYYDPSTDQFLSLDPDVATTDEPYVYSGDDPLNAEDPLGLSPATVALGDAQTDLAAREAAAALNPDAANLAAVRALQEREASALRTVTSQSTGASESSASITPNQAVRAYVSAASNYNARIAQAGGIARDTGITGGMPSVAIPGLHSAWDFIKGMDKSPEAVAEEDPETGIPFVLTVGPAILIGGGLAAVIRATLC